MTTVRKDDYVRQRHVMAHNRDFGAVDGLGALLVPGVGTADPFPLSVCPGARRWAGEVYPDRQCPGQRLIRYGDATRANQRRARQDSNLRQAD